MRRVLGTKKVGHAGTLDPLATGVLPIAVGEATKVVSYLMSSEKVYRFEVCWGVQRDTDDGEGNVIATSDHRPEVEAIQDALKSFVGDIEQVPPKYSAIKIAGKRAYALARNAEEVTIPARKVWIKDLRLIEVKDQNHAAFEVTCGKGTYVRSIARDLAIKLGTVGHVSWLRRTRVGRFTDDMSISLEKIEKVGHNILSEGIMHPIETVLDDIPAMNFSAHEVEKISRGQSVRIDSQTANGHQDGTVLCICESGIPVALANIVEGNIRPKRVFNINN